MVLFYGGVEKGGTKGKQKLRILHERSVFNPQELRAISGQKNEAVFSGGFLDLPHKFFLLKKGLGVVLLDGESIVVGSLQSGKGESFQPLRSFNLKGKKPIGPPSVTSLPDESILVSQAVQGGILLGTIQDVLSSGDFLMNLEIEWSGVPSSCSVGVASNFVFVTFIENGKVFISRKEVDGPSDSWTTPLPVAPRKLRMGRDEQPVTLCEFSGRLLLAARIKSGAVLCGARTPSGQWSQFRRIGGRETTTDFPPSLCVIEGRAVCGIVLDDQGGCEGEAYFAQTRFSFQGKMMGGRIENGERLSAPMFHEIVEKDQKGHVVLRRRRKVLSARRKQSKNREGGVGKWGKIKERRKGGSGERKGGRWGRTKAFNLEKSKFGKGGKAERAAEKRGLGFEEEEARVSHDVPSGEEERGFGEEKGMGRTTAFNLEGTKLGRETGGEESEVLERGLGGSVKKKSRRKERKKSSKKGGEKKKTRQKAHQENKGKGEIFHSVNTSEKRESRKKRGKKTKPQPYVEGKEALFCGELVLLNQLSQPRPLSSFVREDIRLQSSQIIGDLSDVFSRATSGDNAGWGMSLTVFFRGESDSRSILNIDSPAGTLKITVEENGGYVRASFDNGIIVENGLSKINPRELHTIELDLNLVDKVLSLTVDGLSGEGKQGGIFNSLGKKEVENFLKMDSGKISSGPCAGGYLGRFELVPKKSSSKKDLAEGFVAYSGGLGISSNGTVSTILGTKPEILLKGTEAPDALASPQNFFDRLKENFSKATGRLPADAVLAFSTLTAISEEKVDSLVDSVRTAGRSCGVDFMQLVSSAEALALGSAFEFLDPSSKKLEHTSLILEGSIKGNEVQVVGSLFRIRHSENAEEESEQGIDLLMRKGEISTVAELENSFPFLVEDILFQASFFPPGKDDLDDDETPVLFQMPNSLIVSVDDPQKSGALAARLERLLYHPDWQKERVSSALSLRGQDDVSRGASLIAGVRYFEKYPNDLDRDGLMECPVQGGNQDSQPLVDFIEKHIKSMGVDGKEVTPHFFGDIGSLLTCEIAIGSPLQQIRNVLIDTDSSDTWVNCSQPGFFNPDESNTNRLDPSVSTFRTKVGEKGSEGTGLSAMDDLVIGGETAKLISVGQVTEATDSFQKLQVGGTLGLGRLNVGIVSNEEEEEEGEKSTEMRITSQVPLLHSLVEQGLVNEDCFSLYLGSEVDGTSELVLGGYLPRHYSGNLVWTKLLNQNMYTFEIQDLKVGGKSFFSSGSKAKVLIDTRCPQILCPGSLAGDFKDGLMGCQNPISVTIEGQTFSISPDAYQVSEGKRQLPAIGRIPQVFQRRYGVDWIFGLPFLRSVFSVFDKANGCLGFAKARSVPLKSTPSSSSRFADYLADHMHCIQYLSDLNDVEDIDEDEEDESGDIIDRGFSFFGPIRKRFGFGKTKMKGVQPKDGEEASRGVDVSKPTSFLLNFILKQVTGGALGIKIAGLNLEKDKETGWPAVTLEDPQVALEGNISKLFGLDNVGAKASLFVAQSTRDDSATLFYLEVRLTDFALKTIFPPLAGNLLGETKFNEFTFGLGNVASLDISTDLEPSYFNMTCSANFDVSGMPGLQDALYKVFKTRIGSVLLGGSFELEKSQKEALPEDVVFKAPVLSEFSLEGLVQGDESAGEMDGVLYRSLGLSMGAVKQDGGGWGYSFSTVADLCIPIGKGNSLDLQCTCDLDIPSQSIEAHGTLSSWENAFGIDGLLLEDLTIGFSVKNGDWAGIEMEASSLLTIGDDGVDDDEEDDYGQVALAGSITQTGGAMMVQVNDITFGEIESLMKRISGKNSSSPKDVDVDMVIGEAFLAIATEETAFGDVIVSPGITIAGDIAIDDYASVSGSLQLSKGGMELEMGLEGRIKVAKDVEITGASFQLSYRTSNHEAGQGLSLWIEGHAELLDIGVDIKFVYDKTENSKYLVYGGVGSVKPLGDLFSILKKTSLGSVTLSKAGLVFSSGEWDPDEFSSTIGAVEPFTELSPGISFGCLIGSIGCIESLTGSDTSGLLFQIRYGEAPTGGKQLEGSLEMGGTIKLGSGVRCEPFVIGFRASPGPTGFALFLRCGISIPTPQERLTFLFEISMDAIGATGSATMEGEWVNALGIKGLVIADLGVMCGITYATFLSRGPDMIGLKGGIQLGVEEDSPRVDLNMVISEDPTKQFFEGSLTVRGEPSPDAVLGPKEIVEFANNAFGLGLGGVLNKIPAIIQYKNVYFYMKPPEVKFTGTLVLFETIEITQDVFVDETGFGCKTSIGSFSIGPLAISGVGDEPDPICGLEVSKDRQVIFVNGSISLFCFVIAVDVYFESVKNMRFMAHLAIGDITTLDVEASSEIKGAKMDFYLKAIFKNDFNDWLVDQVKDQLNKAIQDTTKDIKEAKSDLTKAKKKQSREVGKAQDDLDRIQEKYNQELRAAKSEYEKIKREQEAKVRQLRNKLNTVKREMEEAIASAKKEIEKVTAECNKKLANAEANLVNVEKNAKAKIASASAKVESARKKYEAKVKSVNSKLSSARKKVSSIDNKIDDKEKKAKKLKKKRNKWNKAVIDPQRAVVKAQIAALWVSMKAAKAALSVAEKSVSGISKCAEKVAFDSAKKALSAAQSGLVSAVDAAKKSLAAVKKANASAMSAANGLLSQAKKTHEPIVKAATTTLNTAIKAQKVAVDAALAAVKGVSNAALVAAKGTLTAVKKTQQGLVDAAAAVLTATNAAVSGFLSALKKAVSDMASVLVILRIDFETYLSTTKRNMVDVMVQVRISGSNEKFEFGFDFENPGALAAELGKKVLAVLK